MDEPGYQHVLKRYANYAPRYDRRRPRYNRATLGKTFETLEGVSSNGDQSLLDVACGTGLLAGMIRRQRPNLFITGVDVSPEMLEKARQRIPPSPETRVDWRLGHAEHLPVESEQFDLLTCTSAFHLVRNANSALTEFHRAMKPGGRLIIVDWCRDFLLMRIVAAWLNLHDPGGRRVRKLNELAELVESKGFVIDRKERFKATWFWGMMCVVARKIPETP